MSGEVDCGGCSCPKETMDKMEKEEVCYDKELEEIDIIDIAEKYLGFLLLLS